VTILANTLEENAASSGGGIYVSAPRVTISDNLVVGNTQANASSTGGGLWVYAWSNLFLINNTIAGNSSAGGGGGAAFQVSEGAVLNVFNNIIWGNSVAAGAPGADVWLVGTGEERIFSYNDANGFFGVWDLFENNLDVDPQFVDPANGNYHLQSGSPCIDAGTNGPSFLPATDLDGNPRLVSGTVDLGCYELGAPTPVVVRLSLSPSGGVMLQWPSLAGATYTVQKSSDLSQAFHDWSAALPATPPINTYSDTFDPTAPAAFYRILVQ
jgi:hypothetical protein